jgi:putative transposase
MRPLSRCWLRLKPNSRRRFFLPVEQDEYFLTVCRYVERNPLRAGLVARVEDWPWSSLWQRTQEVANDRPTLSPWPVACPVDWLNWVNTAQTLAEEEAVRRCSRRGRPFGSSAWTEEMVKKLRLEITLHSEGRPRKNRVDFHPSLFENCSFYE